jgi:two-component system sensor histidine kinase KdpD
MSLGLGRFDGLRGYAETLLLVGFVTTAALVGRTLLPSTSADLLFLLPVLAGASLHGLGPGLLAAGLGALAYNFFFTEPVHSLWIDSPTDTLTVLTLLGVALVTGRLAARLRERVQAAVAQAEQDAALAAFSRALVGAMDEPALGQVVCQEVGRLMDAHAMLVGPAGRAEPGPRLIASHGGGDRLGTFEAEAAEAAMAHRRVTGRGTGVLPASDWTFHPLATAQGIIGALGLARDDGQPAVARGREALLATILDQTALALERQRLAGEVIEVARLREQDRLRGALLASLGHDLRTPLTSILAAAAQLRREGERDGTTLATLEAEARRLDRTVANLLDMVRIEAGALKLRLEPIDLTDAVAAVLRDLKGEAGALAVRVEVAPDLPLVRLDPTLFHHCLLNLVDNALRHGRGRAVTIQAGRATDGVSLEVLDEGPGLPPGQEARAFDTFVRLKGSDRRGGTGLGLAIVKGFAEAMGLGVGAGNRPQGGAVFLLRVPSAQLVPDLEAQAG